MLPTWLPHLGMEMSSLMFNQAGIVIRVQSAHAIMVPLVEDRALDWSLAHVRRSTEVISHKG